MSTATTESGALTTNEAEQMIKDGDGVMADRSWVYTEGEGRGTRYFIDEAPASKAEAVEAVLNADAVAPAGESGFASYDLAVQFAAKQLEDERPLVSEDGVLSLVTGEYVGYVTGSHVEASPAPIGTVDEYRELAAEAMGTDPEDVPIAPPELMEKFETSGDLDQETRDGIGATIERLWEEGHYDHLRSDDDDEE